MNHRHGWRYPESFRQTAVERFKCCENIEWLAKELGVPRQAFCSWDDESQRAAGEGERLAEKSRESRVRREGRDLKRLLAKQALDVDFLRGALQRMEGGHRENRGSGEPASTTTSGA